MSGAASVNGEPKDQVPPEGGDQLPAPHSDRPSAESVVAALLEHSEDGICALDASHRITSFNRAFARNFASLFSAPPRADMGFRELLGDALFAPWHADLERALAGERVVTRGSYPVDGAERVFSISINPIPGGDGRISGTCVISRDVTLERRAEEALQAMGQRFEMARGINDGLWDWHVTSHEVDFSPRWKAMLGHEDQEIGRDIEEWIGRVHPDEREDLWAELTAHIDGSTDHFESEHRVRHKNGLWRWMLSRGIAIHDEHGNVLRMAGSQIDVTERRHAVEGLKVSEERYALASRGANDGLWDWDIRGGTVYFSPRWKAMLGHAPEEVGDRLEQWIGRVHPDDVASLRRDIDAHLEGVLPHLENEHRVLHKDGEYRWVLCRGIAVRNYAGRAMRMAGSLTDITLRKRYEEQLVHDAFHDALTGLPNRALFMDRLQQALARSGRNSDFRFAVLFMDLDRFKVVNDSLGHVAGDRLLVEATQRLRGAVRSVDTLARLGGDEFVLLLDSIDEPAAATRVAERIHEALERPLSLDGTDVYCSMSIGVALSASGYQMPEELIRDADIAMYRAKALGRSRHHFFDPKMHEQAVARLSTETDLRRTLDRHERARSASLVASVETDATDVAPAAAAPPPEGELLLHYQPIVTMTDGQLSGFEALVRWRHPERGMVPPDAFIGIAEETGIIARLGFWVLTEACRTVGAWRRRHPGRRVHVSVNLSPQQFAQEDLVTRIRQVLRETEVATEAVSLEITEGILLADVRRSSAMLDELRTLGIRIHLDDFGTGYSCLSYLHQLPIDGMKVDRSFVRRLGDPRGETIVRTIVELAHSLGMYVLAEGVETREQYDQLRALGCEHAQGYYLSRPVGASEAVLLIAKEHPWLSTPQPS